MTNSSDTGWRRLVLESRQGLWDKVESPPPGVGTGASWTFPTELGEFTYVQSFHADVPDDLMTFEVFDRIGRDLEQAHPDLRAFADKVRDLSCTALQSGLPFDLQMQWRWLVENV